MQDCKVTRGHKLSESTHLELGVAVGVGPSDKCKSPDRALCRTWQPESLRWECLVLSTTLSGYVVPCHGCTGMPTIHSSVAVQFPDESNMMDSRVVGSLARSPFPGWDKRRERRGSRDVGCLKLALITITGRNTFQKYHIVLGLTQSKTRPANGDCRIIRLSPATKKQ